MQIQLIGDNIKINDEFKEIIDEKMTDNLDRLLVDFDDDIKQATMKIGMIKDKNLYQLNFNLLLPGNEHVFAEAEDKYFTTAVVKLREAVESQLRKYKGELQDR